VTIIDKIKDWLGNDLPKISPSVPEPVDYYEFLSPSGSPSATESISPSAEARPSYADLTNHVHYSPNHTGVAYTTSSVGIRDPIFNAETEHLPRPVKVKKSPVVKISSERQNRRLDNGK
jgi:hypothetical protein